MLGAVKMEGHETPDWSSFYTDAQEVGVSGVSVAVGAGREFKTSLLGAEQAAV